MPLAVVALPVALALFWAFGAALARAFWTEGWRRLVVFALAMTLAEWLRGHLFTGFPWNAFGYALMPAPVMMQSAALVGLWGVTLAAFFVFAAPAVTGDDGASRRLKTSVLGVAAFILAAHVTFGAGRLSGGADATVPGVKLRIVQPMIPQDERWLAESGGETVRRYLDLSRGGAAEMTGVTHLFWPESAFPFVLTDRPDVLAAIAALLPPGATLITGAARAERLGGGAPPLVFNSLYVIDDRGEILDAYDKVHLVPFGEYLPFRGLLEAIGLRQMIALPGGFSPGHERHDLVAPGAPPFAPLICYEAIFPGAVTAPGKRPAWLVNVTNDGWYGNTPGPYQHFLQARVRAVEEGLPLVRAANTGISAVVDAHGRVVASLAVDREGVVDSALPAALPDTPYVRFGDWIVVVLGILCAGSVMRRKYTP
jgi:apolipoprotein N-acyltransferase